MIFLFLFGQFPGCPILPGPGESDRRQGGEKASCCAQGCSHGMIGRYTWLYFLDEAISMSDVVNRLEENYVQCIFPSLPLRGIKSIRGEVYFWIYESKVIKSADFLDQFWLYISILGGSFCLNDTLY